MKKKSYINILGFMVLLIFFSICFLSIIQTASTEEITPESITPESMVKKAEPVLIEKAKPKLIAKAEKVKPEHSAPYPAWAGYKAKQEPVIKVKPKPASAPASTPAIEVKSADFNMIPLEDQDCTKCHPSAVKDINERGGLHQSIGCSECHIEHPPLGNDTIPSCEMCHDPEESEHYNIKNCNACHYPHYPTEMNFGEVDTSACLSCHAAQGKEMETQPSEHAGLNCTECHPVHREWEKCADCHTPHAEEMTHADCLACHKPHSPKEVNYTDGVPNNYCACCHEDVGNALASSKKAHSEMSCIECHESEHMAVTQCDGCHDADIHGVSMHERYPLCLDCHSNPHALAE